MGKMKHLWVIPFIWTGLNLLAGAVLGNLTPAVLMGYLGIFTGSLGMWIVCITWGVNHG